MNQLTSTLLVTSLLCAPSLAIGFEGEGDDAPIRDALLAQPEDVRIFDEHVVTLSSPFMEGRVPGSNGMEVAKDYCEFWLKDAGVLPAFEGRSSWRQPFELRGSSELTSQSLAAGGETFVADTDFGALSVGGGGTATGPAVFVGYSIEREPLRSRRAKKEANPDYEPYSTYAEDDDLTGKIAVMFRFEPMDEAGRSLFNGDPWSTAAGFASKVRAATKRGAAGVVLINTPGADDDRVKSLMGFDGGGSRTGDVPVVMVTPEAGARMVEAIGEIGLMELRRRADAGGGIFDLGGEIEVSAIIERKPLVAENVGGILPGKGKLANEIVVIGAHLDHLGNGSFGSRDRANAGKVLHPGADDNASGSAAILMLAERLKQDYDAMPEGSDARSVVFLLFSAEESGLNGSRYYANNPIQAIEDHTLMINFDMIGRIVEGRLSVSGAGTGAGMGEFLAPFFERSPLDIVQPANMSGASDHTSFYQKKMPVLFGIIADFHDDYHTPRDTSDKINRVRSVETIDLFHEILLATSTRPERFEFQAQERGSRRNRARIAEADEAEPAEAEEAEEAAPSSRTSSQIKVRFGIMPGRYEDDEPGVLVGSVTAKTSASEAGVKDGDRLVKWNGKEIEDVQGWMVYLAEHEPGDKVQLTVMREGEEEILWVTLKGKGGDQ